VGQPWLAGSIVFEFKSPPGYVDKKYVSEEGEAPSNFLARILRDRMKDGAVIYPYLKMEMEPQMELPTCSTCKITMMCYENVKGGHTILCTSCGQIHEITFA